PGRIYVPSDISSAAFFIVAALIIPGSNIIIKKVGINPTRTGILEVLKRMGARISIKNRSRSSGELFADLEVKSSVLNAVVINNSEIPSLIDELPILMMASAFAKGRTLIKGAGELRVKETDRIKSISYNLSRLGVHSRVISHNGDEDIEITGSQPQGGASLKSFSDHRTAMSAVIGALACKNPSELDDISCVSKSFPEFMSVLNHLLGNK
ncbi:MAG TPA: 3-phosphoshikimate 1-carboxyvinyltransferase, partial [Candidatus Omnitrophota bacterium]|nr:3-phosphoshikimate 1-carboxyvinyltransferase [Candidatus Omnitrophota bacterium]